MKKKEIIEEKILVPIDKINFINQKYKDKGILNALILAKDLNATEFISTGSIVLDWGLGGGFPKGRFSVINGQKHSGKTFISYKTIAEYQKKNEKPAVLLDIENNFTIEWSDKIGIDRNKLYVIQTKDVNSGIDVVRDLISNHIVGLVVIDSIAAGATIEEMERSMLEYERASGAKMWNKAFRTIQGSLNSKNEEGKTSNCCVIMINQNRVGFGNSGYSYITQPGGEGKNYAASIEINLKTEEMLIEKEGVYMLRGQDKESEIVGSEFRFHISKNKTAPTLGREGNYRILFQGIDAGNYDIIYEIYYLARMKELIKQSGSFFYYKDKSFHGVKKLLNDIRDDENLKLEIYKDIINAIEEKM